MYTDIDVRDQAIEMVEDGTVDAKAMLIMALKYMSTDDVADMLDANELSDRFMDQYPNAIEQVEILKKEYLGVDK
jgi:hypothetical protein